MNDRNLNPAYHEALANARGISTAPPRAVGEIVGYVDGEPAVRWIDLKNMPNVGDMLHALQGSALQHAGFPVTIWDGSKLKPSVRSWSILLTSANHGVVGPLGHPFKHAGEHHERVVVVEVPAAAGAPVDQVDLKLVSGAGAAAADAHPAPGHFAVVKLDEAIAWATQLPIPTRGVSTMVSKLREAREALLVAPAAAQAGQVAPADLHDAIMRIACDTTASTFASKDERRAYAEGHRDARHAAAELAALAESTELAVRKATDELSLPELAEQFAAVEALGCDYTLSAKVCGKLFRAMTTPPEDAAGQVAVPERFVLMPRRLTAENGAKSLFMGEFKESIEVNCSDCEGTDEDYVCATCDDTGVVSREVTIEWDTIKRIYDMAVAHLAAAPSAPAVAQQAPAADTQEAARYRFLRAGFGDFGPDVDMHNAFVDGGEKMDAAIDKAMAAQASTAGERQKGGDRG